MKPFPRWLVWSSSLLTGATGVVYWWMKNVLVSDDPWAVVNHPLQPWVLKAHILVAPVMVFAVGLITLDHVWRHYREGVRAGRSSGLTALWLFAHMVLSGYLVQAVTDATWLSVLVWLHVGTGVAYLTGLALHHRLLRLRANGRRGANGDGPARTRPEGAPRIDVRRPRPGRSRPGAVRLLGDLGGSADPDSDACRARHVRDVDAAGAQLQRRLRP